jgi:hypothetical protein
MRKILFVIICFCFVIASCSDRYLTYKPQYHYKSENGGPDYSKLEYWAAHPWKKDPSDSIPEPLRNEQNDSLADVFFLHPTMFTMKLKTKKWNADIDDNYISAKTDYSTILYQASVFNRSCRIFAPRYREAHLDAFYTSDTVEAGKAFDLAYKDLKAAFEYYLQNYNGGRPIIIAAHSQGSKLALRLLKDFFDEKPLQKQLVVVYLLGWQIPKNYFTTLQMCADSTQTGCLCGWRTLRRDYIPIYLEKETGDSYVTNPLTWTITEEYAPRELNKGSVLYNFNKIYPGTSDAQINNNVLWICKPKFPGGALYLSKNYHAGDFNIFYMNVRDNVRTRIYRFLKSG